MHINTYQIFIFLFSLLIAFLKGPYAAMAEQEGSSLERKLTISENRKAMQELKNAILNKYSYRDLRNLDWGKLFQRYTFPLQSAKTRRDFIKVASEMLAQAKDTHIFFKVEEEFFYPFNPNTQANINSMLIKKYVQDLRQHNKVVVTGKLKGNAGYIFISSWSRKQGKETFEPAFEALESFQNLPAVVIDVRGNPGGNDTYALELAGCFTDKPRLFSKYINVNQDLPIEIFKVRERYFKPSQNRPHYSGKIFVLMGEKCMSSCEAFLLMMKQVPGSTLIGERSGGSSGNPKPTQLSNGVTVFLPSFKVLQLDGSMLEGKGIEPDIEVKTTQKELKVRDPVIEKVLELL